MESQSQPQTGTPLPPQNGPAMPTKATKHDIDAILNGSALNHLAPISGGRWKLVSQHYNTIVVAYHVNRRAVFTTTVQIGTNPDTVNNQCWQYVYGYPTAVASLTDGGLQEWTPPVSNIGNRAEEVASLTQTYNQILDANHIMATGAPLRQSGVFPGPIDAQLPEAGDFSISMLDQAQPQSQAQEHNETIVSDVGSFHNMQSLNMAGVEPGDFTAFQNVDDSAHGGINPIMLHDGNDDEADISPHWNSFSESI
ncbi:hypothetical protein FPOAC2_05147 [Fusarium poae]|uniref:hypothetical protein n=1 Tax=Fusarium poae TaxID=36050 RepID=UPI001CEABEFA|nr:hypothetical protein FPOAC1_005045 [Fusarium poae]KAG8671787.1 hypothetical protein FPOAC1_005045 [Fusarium poae]